MVSEWYKALIVLILVHSTVQDDNANKIVAARVEVSVVSVER
jgi:hypothetical protein